MRTVLFICLAAIVIAVSVVFVGQKAMPTNLQTIASPIAPAIAQENSEVHSGDGSKKIIMRVTSGNESKTYSFSTADVDGKNEIQLLSYPAPGGITFTIPQNAWSPDNKYVFIKENSGSGFDFWVFQANGQAFTSGDKYLTSVSLFAASQPKLKIRDITGWDASTLLNLQSTKDDGTNGPTFWFEVPSRAFIQLWR